MERVFFYIFNMSLTASLLTVAILALRLLLKKTPKAFFCILWGFVAIRLIFPITPESPFSLIPESLTVTDSVLSDNTPMENSTVSVIDPVQEEPFTEPKVTDTLPGTTDNFPIVFSEAMQTTPAAPTDEANLSTPVPATSDGETVFLKAVSLFATVIWPIGIAAMLLYAAFSYVRIHRKIKEAVLLSDTIWLCDHVATPFIFGIFRPRILLPSTIKQEDAEYVIAHEKAHLKRLDHLWKPLGFVLLSVYWFNPVMWIAYIFLCKDIELACDERVIQRMDAAHIKSYSSTLLAYSISRKTISFCPLAFGEVHVKKRIKNVLHYKRPAFWIILLGVIACTAVAVCFLTDPVKQNKESERSEDAGELLFLSFVQKDSGSDIIGLTLSTESQLSFTKDRLSDLSIPVQWTNNNYNRDVTYGERFDILRYENGLWNSCAKEDYNFPLVTRTLSRKESHTQSYSLNEFDLLTDGLYRFRAEPSDGQYVWFDFEVITVYENNVDSLSDSALLAILHYITEGKESTVGLRTDHKELFDILLANGDTTVNCFVNTLTTAESYALKEYFMAQICSELTGVGLEQGEYDPDTWWATADEWLEIYNDHLIAKKYEELAVSQGNSPTDTTASWKNTDYTALGTQPKTPQPRPLVWVNYFYNRTKTPDGSLRIELPEFPGVTLLADSQKICAETSAGTQTLIAGKMLWTTYLADLNNDNYPELCATVSTEATPEHLGLVVYDMKNKITYELRDSVRYDYSLFGNYYSMFVQRTDRMGTETEVTGRLSLTTDTATGVTSLSLTQVHSALTRSLGWPETQLDLLSYSNLYADLAINENRYSSKYHAPLCCFLTAEDWEAFTAVYSDVSIWKDNKILSLSEALDTEVNAYIELCGDDDFYATLLLSPHGLSVGVYGSNKVTGFAETLAERDDTAGIITLPN